jgi:hypothetical protein
MWLAAGSDGAIRVSTDRGETWTVVQQWAGVSFSDLATDGHGTWVAVARDGSVRTSQDRGATWQAGTIDLATVHAVATDGYGTWVAGGDDELPGVLRDSVDAGATWDTPVAPATTGAVSGIASDGLTSVAVTTVGEVLRSTSPGVSWTQVADVPGLTGDVATDGAGTWVAAGGASGALPSLFITTSTDDGLTWQTAEDLAVEGLTSVAWGGGMFVAVGAGVGRSADGLTWDFFPPVAVLQTVEDLATDGGGRWLATIDRSVYASDNNGATWTQVEFLPAGSSAGAVAFGY